MSPRQKQGRGSGSGRVALESDQLDAQAYDLEQLRASARHVGAWRAGDSGWFRRVVRERVQRGSSLSATGEGEASGLDGDADSRAERRIQRACRKAGFAAGLSSASAHLGELLVLATEGLAAPLGIPAILASVAIETVYSAIVQVDLACDLASIYGVPFVLDDEGELATVFDLALRFHSVGGLSTNPGYLLCPDDTELLARLGRSLCEDALIGVVPFVGIPCSAVRNYRMTRRLGDGALAYARRRRAVRRTLGAALAACHFDTTLLLEGAWLLATADGVVTHEELILLSTIARAIPTERRPDVERLHHVGEGVWIARMARLDGYERDAILAGLHLLAGLRGPTAMPERRFLQHVGDALGQTVDFAQIAEVQREIDHGYVPSSLGERDGAWAAVRATRPCVSQVAATAAPAFCRDVAHRPS